MASSTPSKKPPSPPVTIDPAVLAAAIATALATHSAGSKQTTTPPIRGGIDPVHGIYLGGASLQASDYTSISRGSTFYSTQQCRGHKDTVSIERALIQDQQNSSLKKFDGNLEIPNGSLNELSKEDFIEALKVKVERHGQDIFYVMIDPSDATKLLSTINEHHLFTLQAKEPS